MGLRIETDEFIEKIQGMIAKQHDKLDGIISLELMAKSEGFIEALYQVERLAINLSKD